MSKFNENAVQEAAYFIWQNAGCPQGQDEYFWSMAIEQVSCNCSKSSCSKTSSSSSAKKTSAPKKTVSSAKTVKSSSSAKKTSK